MLQMGFTMVWISFKFVLKFSSSHSLYHFINAYIVHYICTTLHYSTYILNMLTEHVKTKNEQHQSYVVKKKFSRKIYNPHIFISFYSILNYTYMYTFCELCNFSQVNFIFRNYFNIFYSYNKMTTTCNSFILYNKMILVWENERRNLIILNVI